MKAKEYANEKIKLPDGSLVSLVIWELPAPTTDRPHGFKYRLNYCTAEGITIVRYDNERGKGDHKHIGKREEPYAFRDVDTLIDDFWRDVDKVLEKKEHE